MRRETEGENTACTTDSSQRYNPFVETFSTLNGDSKLHETDIRFSTVRNASSVFICDAFTHDMPSIAVSTWLINIKLLKNSTVTCLVALHVSRFHFPPLQAPRD